MKNIDRDKLMLAFEYLIGSSDEQAYQVVMAIRDNLDTLTLSDLNRLVCLLEHHQNKHTHDIWSELKHLLICHLLDIEPMNLLH